VPVEKFLSGDTWVKFDGLFYLLTPETLFAYYLHSFEPHTAQEILRAEGDVFLDIGANVGQYALPLARRFDRVVAVEANPAAVAVLERNLERNGIRNVEIIQRAVRPASGKVRLYAGDVMTTWNVRDPSDHWIEVESISLDEILERFEHVSLINIDIEGIEASVLASSKLLKKVDTISVSILPTDIPGLGGFLVSHGYELSQPPSLFRSEENYFARRPATRPHS